MRGVSPGGVWFIQTESIGYRSDFSLYMTLLFGLRINTGIPLTLLEERFRDPSHMEDVAAVHCTPPRGIEAALREQ